MREIALTTAEQGQRLDRYLRKLLPETPLGAIFKMMRRGFIRVDGKRCKPELRLEMGMVVTLPDSVETAASRPATGASTPPPPELTPRVVHRDRQLLVVDKPEGLPAQPGSGHDHSLASWLDQQPWGVRTATFRPAPVHRLDRGTSGLVACALEPEAGRTLAAAFREDLVQKAYVAVVEGDDIADSGEVDAPLLLRPNARASQPKVLVDPAGKPARTTFEVLRRGRGRALLRVTLHTGRTHQIRAHLGHVGHPIVGDRRYGARSDLGRGRFLLHAALLILPHPETGAAARFEAPTPARLRDAVDVA